MKSGKLEIAEDIEPYKADIIGILDTIYNPKAMAPRMQGVTTYSWRLTVQSFRWKSSRGFGKELMLSQPTLWILIPESLLISLLPRLIKNLSITSSRQSRTRRDGGYTLKGNSAKGEAFIKHKVLLIN